jgi:maltose O-acetyltransferase
MAEAQQRLRRLNAPPNEDFERRFVVLQALLGQIGNSTQIKSPFACDYGLHIRIGRNGFVNYGCVFLDCNHITIGVDAQIGPGVHIYTAFHPLEADLPRNVSPPKWGIPASQNQQLMLSSVRYAAAKDAPAKREGGCRPLIVSRPHD